MTRTHLITGSFGAGKTTAIRRLMSRKPQDEFWMVVLNEFTEAGTDAITVAEAARGAYDVRMVAGGCLCCVGELEFEKQLRDILRNLKPARLLIEPSGAGHAADIVDALASYQAQGALSLDSIVCLIDPLDTERILKSKPAGEWSQIQSADVLLLSKPDLAGEAERLRYRQIAEQQFPSKAHLGEVSFGELPPEALHAYQRAPRFSLLHRAPATATSTTSIAIGPHQGTETRLAQLDLFAVQWLLPAGISFSRIVLKARLDWLLGAYQGQVRRMKAVFRTGPGPSWLVQWSGHGLNEEDSAHRRDSRLELVLESAPSEAFLNDWRGTLADAANP
jgi:G3E family GTPase